MLSQCVIEAGSGTLNEIILWPGRQMPDCIASFFDNINKLKVDVF